MIAVTASAVTGHNGMMCPRRQPYGKNTDDGDDPDRNERDTPTAASQTRTITQTP